MEKVFEDCEKLYERDLYQYYTVGFSGRAGRLLTLLGSSSPGKRSDRLYQNTPKLGLVMSGCQAVLQFVGCNDILHGSSLDTSIYNTCCMQGKYLNRVT